MKILILATLILSLAAGAAPVYVCLSPAGQFVTAAAQTDAVPGHEWHLATPRLRGQLPPPNSIAFGYQGAKYYIAPSTWESYRAELAVGIAHYATATLDRLAVDPEWAAANRANLASYYTHLQGLPDDPNVTPAAARAILRQYDTTLAALLELPPCWP